MLVVEGGERNGPVLARLEPVHLMGREGGRTRGRNGNEGEHSARGDGCSRSFLPPSLPPSLTVRV